LTVPIVLNSFLEEFRMSNGFGMKDITINGMNIVLENKDTVGLPDLLKKGKEYLFKRVIDSTKTTYTLKLNCINATQLAYNYNYTIESKETFKRSGIVNLEPGFILALGSDFDDIEGTDFGIFEYFGKDSVFKYDIGIGVSAHKTRAFMFIHRVDTNLSRIKIQDCPMLIKEN